MQLASAQSAIFTRVTTFYGYFRFVFFSNIYTEDSRRIFEIKSGEDSPQCYDVIVGDCETLHNGGAESELYFRPVPV